MKGIRFYIESYGCQMNVYDSLIARRILKEYQATPVDQIESANLILLNTCAVRESAHQKIYSKLKSLYPLWRRGVRIGILGCMSQNLKEELLEKDLPIDFILGPDALKELPKFLEKDLPEERAYLRLNKKELYEEFTPTLEEHLSVGKISAFITIQRGCNNFCTFCVVPYTRGRERSRAPESIIREIKELEKAGIKIITLLGQNVNSYRYEKYRFVDLVKKIFDETQIEALYFTSPHPKDFPRELIELMAEEKRFIRMVHIPLQAGSNRILRMMKRNYTKEEFLSLIERFRSMVEDVCITTDVIVGFPTETEEEFEETLEVMEKANFDFAFMFAYSERKGTIAKKLYPDNIPYEEKKRRLEILIEEQEKRSLRNQKKYIGKKVEVFVEGRARRTPDKLFGRMRNGRKVVFSSSSSLEDLLGKWVEVDIHSCSSHTLFGHSLA